MKKNFSKNLLSLFLIVFLSLALGIGSQASKMSINIDGKRIPLDQADQEIIVKDERTMVPLRLVTENLGFKVDWNSETKDILLIKEGLEITIYTDGKNPLVNGQEFDLDVKPFIKGSTSYLPLRFIGESLGKKVSYGNYNSMQTVFISDEEIYISKNPISHKKESLRVNGKNKTMDLVTIDYRDPRVKMEASLANNKVNSVEAFSSFIKRKKPLVALNGYFFDSYSGKNLTNGYIKNNYKILNHEILPAAFFVDDQDKLYMENPHYFKKGQDKIKTGVSVLPHLVSKGKIIMDDSQLIHGKGKSSAPRMAIGFTEDGLIKIVSTNGTTKELAIIMKNLGCVEAGNLDGGASAALYYKGKTLRKPGRNLNNFISFTIE